MDIIELLKVFFLAVFQGIAEFLPISSSGHLAVLGKLFNIDPESNFLLAIVLHMGTLLAIIIFYFKKIIDIVFKWQWDIISRLIVATIPVGIIGIVIKKFTNAEAFFDNLFLVSGCFLVTAILLLIVKKQSQSSSKYELKNLPFKNVLFTGIMQGIAILPGISRSGSTIFGGLKSGLSSRDSAEFSFLMGAAAIAGASLLEIMDCFQNSSELIFDSATFINLITGFIVSGVVGYFSLKLLLKILNKGKLEYFSYYLFFAAAATLILELL